MNGIVAIIPAAGRGSRLAPFPCPKELFPVGYQDVEIDGVLEERPKVVSQYLLESMVAAGSSRVFIILGEGKADIMTYYGDGRRFGTDICYLYQEELRGMPFAIDLARCWMNDDTVLFGMPDTIIEPRDSFERLLAFHHESKAQLTLGLFRTGNPSKFGMVETDEHNTVIYTVDKPAQTDLTQMWGTACWSPEFTGLIHRRLVSAYEGHEIVLGDLFNFALEEGLRVKGLVFDDGQYIDIGTAAELNLALRQFHL